MSQDAWQPYQFALSSRAGAPSASFESNPEATLLSVDGVGAFDTISRHMLGDLLKTPGLIFPFVRMFYSEPSEYVWHDANGVAHLLRLTQVIRFFLLKLSTNNIFLSCFLMTFISTNRVSPFLSAARPTSSKHGDSRGFVPIIPIMACYSIP